MLCCQVLISISAEVMMIMDVGGGGGRIFVD